MSDPTDEIDRWKQAGEELRASLLRRRTVALAELSTVEDALARLETIFGTPTPAAGQGKRIDSWTSLRPWFPLLQPNLRAVVDLRAAGHKPGVVAEKLDMTKKNAQNLAYRAKAILCRAREAGPPPADEPPASDADEEPAPAKSAVHVPDRPIAARERRPRAQRDPEPPAEPTSARPKDANFAVFSAEMRQHTVLTRETELELFNQWKQTGDRRIANQFVAANLRFVLMIAKQYDRGRHNVLDLVQEGSIGLFHALSKYDPTRGIRFISYASHWIRAYIMKFMLANHHLVKLGTTQTQRKLFFNLNKTRALLEKDGAVATVEQIAGALEVDTSAVEEMEMRMNSAITPLDVPMLADADAATSRHTEFPADEKWRPDIEMETHDFRSVAKHHIAAFGHTLNPRQKIIFTQRLVAEDPVTLVELAGEMGVTRERVRQIEEKIKARLKTYLRARMRMEDLDLAI